MVSNLSKVPENRTTLLKELVSVAKSLCAVSTHDLQSLGHQLDAAKRDAIARVSHSRAVVFPLSREFFVLPSCA